MSPVVHGEIKFWEPSGGRRVNRKKACVQGQGTFESANGKYKECFQAVVVAVALGLLALSSSSLSLLNKCVLSICVVDTTFTTSPVVLGTAVNSGKPSSVFAFYINTCWAPKAGC